MAPAPDLLAHYGAAVVFAWAFAVQAGLPAPAVPMLLGAGALSGSGHMDLAVSILAAMTATLGADVLWYALGRSHGLRVLETLCRFSLDPDSLIRHAKERFAAHRARYLIVAKFLPGVNPLAAGLAGVVALRVDFFLFYAAAGALLWAGAWIMVGYLFARRHRSDRDRECPLRSAVAHRDRGGAGALHRIQVREAAPVSASSRKARIDPVELKRRVERRRAAGDRRSEDESGPRDESVRNPWARWISPEMLRDPHQLIPKRSEIVFYCAEPERQRALGWPPAELSWLQKPPSAQRGLEGWRQAGFAVEPLASSRPVRSRRSSF